MRALALLAKIFVFRKPLRNLLKHMSQQVPLNIRGEKLPYMFTGSQLFARNIA